MLHRAERADVLATALADILRQPPADPFAPEVVAVHSRGVERWLSHHLAARLGTSPGRSDGVCANLSFPFPGRLVGDLLAGATGVERTTDPWRPERLAWPLLSVVDASLDEPWLAGLAAHLGGADPESADRDRRFATVRHVADLLDRYALHRPDMVLAWAAGADTDDDGRPLPDDVAWQARLWRRLRAAVGTPSPAERLVEGCAALAADPALAQLPDRICLFGFTRLPASYLDVLGALAAHRDVHLFALHPSPVAWARAAPQSGEHRARAAPQSGEHRARAAPQSGEHRARAAPQSGEHRARAAPQSGEHRARAAPQSGEHRPSAAPAGHPLLRSWGSDSHEMQLVLQARPEVTRMTERHHRLEIPPASTLLQHLQEAIRSDEAPAVDGRPLLAADDRSVQVHACHGQARQAEVVRDAIAHLLAADPTLEPRDIVVLCPDIDELAPLLHAAFDSGTSGGTTSGGTTSGGTATGGTGAGAGAEQGPPALPYRLADRSLRQTNPVLGAVAALLALVDARLTATQVLAFAALAPVRERFDLDDADLARINGWVRATGTRWGLDAASRACYDLAEVDTGTWDAGLTRLLLGVAMSEDDHRLVGGALPLDDVDSGDIALAGRLAELVSRLGQVVGDMTGRRPIAAWLAAMDRAADLLLATRPDETWQRGQLDRLLVEVQAESGIGAQVKGVAAACPQGPPLRLAEVRDLLNDRLRGQPSRAAFRTGDITMCTLVPMRSVPHRVVCLVGMDDGAFPRGGSGDGDDLLVRARRVGDHDRRSEDRQLLLDAVLSAGDALVVTYAGRDVRTNERLPPAVPVNELLDVLDATVRTAGGTPARLAVVHQHPLLTSDRRCFEPGRLGTEGPWSYDPTLLAGARAAAGPRHRPGPFLASPLPPPLPPPLAPAGGDVVALEDLVHFVQHPVGGFLRQRLGLSLRADEEQPVDALAVELDGLAAWGVGDRLLRALLAGGDVEAVCAAEEARGLLPPGALGRAALDDARRKAEAVAGAALDAARGPANSVDVEVQLLDGRLLVGTVPDVVGSVVRAASFSRLAPKHRLAAWVRFLAVTASHPAADLTSTTIGRHQGGARTFVLGSLAGTGQGRRERALELLEVVVDLWDRGLCEPLPLYGETSHRYAAAVRAGAESPEADAARCWTSEFSWDKEDKDPAHILVLGGVRSFDEVLAMPPRTDEEWPGWPPEPSRFARLSRRLWDPVLDAAAAGPQGSR